MRLHSILLFLNSIDALGEDKAGLVEFPFCLGFKGSEDGWVEFSGWHNVHAAAFGPHGGLLEVGSEEIGAELDERREHGGVALPDILAL